MSISIEIASYSRSILSTLFKGVFPALIAFLFIPNQTALAASVTIVSQQDFWNYNVTATDFGQNGLATVDYNGFLAEYTGTSMGQAAFGNHSVGLIPVPNTDWAAGTDLALQLTENLAGTVIGDVTLNLAVDNGAKVFVNGIEVFYDDAGGFTNIWEYTTTVDGSLFVVGDNTISVLANDYGQFTYFDMELIAENGINPIPLPAAVWLFGSTLIGLMGMAAKRKNTLADKSTY